MTAVDDRGYFMLPQNPDEAGYYVYGTPSGGQGQYAHPAMLTFLFWLELRWSAVDKRKFGVGNISLANGLRFPPHRSHTNGLQVDLRPLRKDGAELPVSYKSDAYDQLATKKLISLIESAGRASKVFFNDPHIHGVKPLNGHDDHIHVEIHL